MSTYCRITGKSRGLPKPHYFPLLPPISPADAKRLCRITGKSYGLPTHHYIPVVTALSRKRKIKCQVTAKSDGQATHHFQPAASEATKHSVLKSFRYVVPVLETNAELLELLGAKVDGASNENAKFVYTVHERQYGLVLPAQLEAAVRDGDVRDIMLAKDADKLVLKLRKGASVEVDIRDAALDQWDLFEGEGPNQDIVIRRKKQRRGTDTNDWRRKIFEDKEKEADSEEERITQIRSKRPAKSRLVAKANPVLCSWKNVSVDGAVVRGDPKVDSKVRKSILEALGKRSLVDFVDDNQGVGEPVVRLMPTPLKIDAESVDLCHSLPGLVQQPVLLSDGVIGFRVASVVTPFQPNMAQVDVATSDALTKLNENKATLKKALAKQNSCLKKCASMLVRVDEIPAAVASIAQVIERGSGIAKHKFEQGMKLTLKDSEKYVPGQFFATGKGEIFIPGNVVETATGPQFVPGFAISTDDGEPKFVPGFIIKEDQSDPIGTFVAGQLVLTRDGEKFVQGQRVVTGDGSRFMPGQTVFTTDGVKFVPGQVVEDPKVESGFRFVPGQTIMTNEGAQFVPGQFIETPSGLSVFQPGQSVLNENFNWEFVQGQNFKGDDGDLVFVPGKEILSEDGHRQFIPGRILINENQSEIFIPGITMTDESGKLKFVPGMELETDNGVVFVEGIVAELDDSTHSFLIGKVSSTDEADGIHFERAVSPEGVVVHDIIPHLGLSISSINRSDTDDNTVFGHMVQSSQGIEFFPGEAAGLPAGKVIPGRLVKDDETQFIPGTMIDEKFIPGQVIDTNAGPKFVPGQVLHTSSGPKFVPGQTMDTENGPKFIPGQIIDTKSGPTFIPGQVISTDEEGSRFVPGQVVDTMEGPRFVPGRVVETGDGVAFIPGQIVETEDGLRFVAPDLEDDPEGGYQFTLQGFEVAQEELKMIQRNTVPSACLAGQLAIDWKMLQQLSDAGMAVGRQIPVDIPDVDIKSSHIAEVACTIINNLNLDSSYSIQMNHILSNVLQIAQSNVLLPEVEMTKDENLKLLINLTEQFKHSLDSPEFLNTLGNAIVNIINADLDHKQQSINTLHAVTVDLATKVREKQMGKILPSPAVQMARKMANKMNLDGASSIKMSHILSNIQQLKDLNVAVLDEEITDKNLQAFLNVAIEGADNVGDEEYMQVLGKALENAIKLDTDNQSQNIETLESITNNLASKVRAKKLKKVLSVPIMEMACQVASKLGLDPQHSTKIGHILLNMQQAKQSDGLVLNKDIGDEDSRKLVNATLKCRNGGNEELLQSLGNALENIINEHDQDKLQKIDHLLNFSANLAKDAQTEESEEISPSSAVIESACKIAKKFEVGGLDSIKINDILLNLQTIKQSNIPIAVQKIADKNLKKLLSLVLDSKSDSSSVESVQAFAAALEETLKADPEQLNTIGTLHTLTTNMANDIHQQKVSENLPLSTVEFVYKTVEELDIDPSYTTKIGKILSNLQQIRQAKLPSPNGKIKDKNLKNLLLFVSSLDAKKSNAEIYDDLGEALMSIIKTDSNKERTINTLLALSDDLALKARAQKISVQPAAATEAAYQVAKKLKVGSTESIKIKNILSNLQQIQSFNIPLRDIKNENLKSLLQCAAQEESCESREEFFKKLGSALEDIALTSSESVAQTIDTLHNLTEKLQTDIREKELEQTLSLDVVENACQLARNLNLTPAQSIKMGQILSNLQQLNKSERRDSVRAHVKDENLKILLDLAATCETEGSDTLQSLEKALEKTIKIDPDRKINIIDSLHNATTKLVSNVHKKVKNRHVANMVSQISQKFKVDEPTARKISKILTNMQQIKQSNVTILQNVEDENLKNLLNLASEFEEGKGDAEILQSLGNALEAAIKTDVTCKLKTIDNLHLLTSNFMDKTYHEQQTPILSILSPQMASFVADELSVDHLHSIKINKIFENLQQIRKSGLKIPLEEIKDEKLKHLLHAAASEPEESEAWLQNVSNVLKDVVKQDLIHKFETISTLHELTENLASKTQGNLQNEVLSIKVAEKACKMAKKLQLSPSNSLKLGAIMQNLQQIKKGKISSNNVKVKDKNLKTLLKVSNEFKDETSPEFADAVSNTLEKMICQNLDHKQQTINTLHSLTADLASFVRDQQLNTIASLPTAEMASQIADNMNVDLESSIKINSILSNIQQIKLNYSNIPPDEIVDENLRILLNASSENGENFEGVEYLQVICDALENIIKVDLDHKEQNINALHLSTVNLARKLQAKQSNTTLPLSVLEVACKVAEKLHIDPSYSIKMSSILSNAQKMEKSDIIDLKDEADDGTMKSLLNIALQSIQNNGNNSFVESLENNLESIIQSALENNQETINSLHAMTVKLTSKVRDKQATKIVSAPLFEKATKVASDLNISPTYVVKMSNILANLQQIKQSNVAIFNDEIVDENLKKLLNVVSASENNKSEEQMAQILGDALESVLKEDQSHKLQHIDVLQALTADLASNIANKQVSQTQSSPIAEVACKVANKLNVGPSHSIKMSHIISNLKQIKESHVAILDEITDSNLKKLVDIAMEVNVDKDQEKLFQALGNALEDVICVDLDNKLQTIDNLHLMTANLASSVSKKQSSKTLPLPVIEMACSVASKLDIDPSYSVKMGHILSNLQQIKLSNVPVITAEISDDNLKALVNIAMDCNEDNDSNGAQFLQKIGDALQMSIGQEGENKLQSINTLYLLTTELSSKIHDAEVGKILSLPIIEMACSVASDLNIDPLHTIKLSQILSNIKQITESKGHILEETIPNEKLKQILATVAEYENCENTEVLQKLGNALKQTISADLNNKLQIIDNLHEASESAVTKLLHQRSRSLPSPTVVNNACKVAKNLKLETSSSVPISFILWNLQQLDSVSLNEILKTDAKDENLKCLIKSALKFGEKRDASFVKGICDVLQKIVKGSVDEKKHTIKMLCSLTTNLASKVTNGNMDVTSSPESKMSEIIVRKCKLDASSAVLIENVLNNLQKIQNSNIPYIFRNGVKDENLQKVFQLMSACEKNSENSETLTTLGEALQQVLDENVEDEQKILTMLHATTTNLVANISERSGDILPQDFMAKISETVAKKMKVDPTCAVLVEHILRNVQQIKKADLKNILSNGINENISVILKTALENDAEGEEAVQILSDAICNSIKGTKEQKEEKLNNLYTAINYSINKSNGKVDNNSPSITEAATPLIKDFELSPADSIQVVQILSNLQKIKKSDLPHILGKGASDENLQMVLDLVGECNIQNSEVEQMKTISCAIKNILENDDNISQKISVLHATTSDLASSVRVEDKSPLAPLTTQISEGIVKKMNIDSSCVPVVEQILQNMQTIDKGNIKKILNNGIRDGTLSGILKEILKSDEHTVSVEALGDILVKSVKGTNEEKKQKLATLYSSINNAQAKNDILWTGEKATLASALVTDVTEVSASLINNLGLNSIESVQVVQILDNLQKIKKSTLPSVLQKGTTDKNIQAILTLASAGGEFQGEKLQLQSIGGLLENIIVNSPESKSHIISILHAAAADVASTIQEQPTHCEPLIAKLSENLAEKLHVNPNYAVLIKNVLQNIQQIEKSNIPQILNNGLKNEQFRDILKVVQDNTADDAETTRMLSDVLHNTIKGTTEQKENLINLLYSSTFNLKDQPTLTPDITDIAAPLISKLDLNPSSSRLMINTISNLQKLKKSDIPNLLKKGTVDENVQMVLEALNAGNEKQSEPEQLKAMGTFLENMIGRDPKCKLQMLNLLHAVTSDLVVDIPIHSKNIPSALVAKVSEAIADQMKLDPTCSILVEHIVQNIQGLPKSTIQTILDQENIDENLRQILMVASKSDGPGLSSMQQLGDVLLQTIKGTGEEKEQMLNSLYAKTCDIELNSQSSISSSKLAEVASPLVAKLGLCPSNSSLIVETLNNLQKIKNSKLNTLLQRGNVDENVQVIMKCLSSDIDQKCKGDQLQSIGNILEEIINQNPEQKLNTIAALHATAAKLASNIPDNSEDGSSSTVIKISEEIAKKLELNSCSFVLVKQMLQNLHQVDKVDLINILKKGVSNKTIREFLKAFTQCNLGDEEAVPIIVKSFEKLTKGITGDKEKTINELYTHVCDILSSIDVHNSDHIPLVIEVATPVIAKLNLSPSVSAPIIEILTNLQKIEQSSLVHQLQKGSLDENIQVLLDLASTLDKNKNRVEQVQGACDILEKVLGKSPEQQSRIINILHAVAKDLATNVGSEMSDPLIDEAVGSMVKDLNLNPSTSLLIGKVLENVQKLKKSDLQTILQQGTVSESMQDLIKTALKCDGKESKEEVTKKLADAFQKSIKGNGDQKEQKINSLYTQSINVLADLNETQDKTSKLSSSAMKLTKRLHLPASSSAILGHLVSNLQQIKKSDVQSILQQGEQNENILMIADIVSVNDNISNNSKLQRLIEQGLEENIRGTLEEKLEIINALHAVSVDIVSNKLRHNVNDLPPPSISKIAVDLTKKMKLSRINAQLVGPILWNLQKLNKTDLQNILNKGTLDVDLQDLLKTALNCNDGNKVTETLTNVLQIIIKRHPDHEEETVNLLYSHVVNLLTESTAEKSANPSSQVMDVASNLSEKLNLNPSSSSLIASIFCNIQKLKELPLHSLTQTGELGADTKMILNLVLECNGCTNEEEMLKTFEEAATNAVCGNQMQKLMTLNLLHSTIADMVSTLSQEQINNIPAPLTRQMASMVAKKIDVDVSNIPVIENILSNLQEVCKNNSKGICEYGPVHKNLQILLDDALLYSDKAPDQITHILAESLQKVINASPIDKEEKLNCLYSSTLNLLTNTRKSQLNAVCLSKTAKVARALASNLDMAPDETPLIEQVLSAVHQIIELNSVGELEFVKMDDTIEQIIELNSELDDEVENLPERLGKVLEKVISGGHQEKLDQLTTLHATASNIIFQVRQKQSINNPPIEVTRVAQNITKKLDLDSSNSMLIERAIWNLEQLTPANCRNILKKGVPNESLRALLKVLVEENNDHVDVTLTLGSAIQKLIKGTSDQKEQKIQELYSSTFLLVSETQKFCIDESSDVSIKVVIPLTKRLQLDIPTSNLIANMLINLRKIKKSTLPKILQEGVVDKNVQVVLDLLTACNDNDEELTQIKSMSGALESLIENNPEQKVQLISKLHAVTLDLLPSMPSEETVRKPTASVASTSKAVIKKLNIGESKTVLIEKLLTNLQDIKKSASNLQIDDIVAEDDFKKILKIVLDMPSNTGPEKVAQLIGDALQKAIKGTREQKEDEINTLYAKSIDVLFSLPSKSIACTTESDIAEVAHSLAKNLELGSADTVLLRQILSNIQTIEKSRLSNILKNGVLDERLQPVISLIVKSEENEGKMEKLHSIGSALQSIINEKPDKKQQLLNSIHVAAVDLISYLQKNEDKNLTAPPSSFTETAQKIAEKLMLDSSHTAIVSQTLWNLQQASKANLNNILGEGILDDNAKKLVHQVIEAGDCKTDAEVAQALGHAFEQAVQVNLLTDAKTNQIENLIPPAVSEVTNSLIQKLKIDPWHATLVGHFLNNLKKIKQSNIPLPVEEKLGNDRLKVIDDLLVCCDKNQSETEMLQSFSSGLEKAVQGTEKQKLVKLLIKLHATSENLLSSVFSHQTEDIVPSVVGENAVSLTEKLKLDSTTAKLVQNIMLNILQLNETEIHNALQKGVDDTLKAMLDVVLEVGDKRNVNAITSKFCKKLENIIKGTTSEKKQKIHELYAASMSVGSSTPNQPTLNTLPEAAMQVADKVIKKLKIDSWHAKLIGHVLCNLKHIHQKSVSSSIEKGTLDENLQEIIDLALEFKKCSEEPDMLPAFGAALEKTIRGDAEWKLQSLNQLHAATVALMSESNRQQVLNNPPPLVAETSSHVAKKLHLVRSSSVLLGHLLWNLQQIRKADLQRTVQKGVADDNLQILLSVALDNFDQESGELTQTLGDTLYKLLKNDLKLKDQKIDSLYASTINLLTNLHNGNMGGTSAISETAAKIADELNINESYSEKVGHILSNLQQIKRANVALLSEKNRDESLKVLLSLALESSNDRDGRPSLEQMRNALESSILIDMERKLQTINALHAKTANLASKVKDKQSRRFIPMTAIETACKVASRLNIDPTYSVKISGILSNLQEIKQSNTPLIYQKITDESLRKLLDLSLECDSQKEGSALLQSLGDALEKTIKANLAQKLETIDSLHALTLDLTFKVREEQSKKIIPVSVIESACKVASKLQIDPALSIKMSNILCNLLRIKQSFVLLNANEIQDGNLKLLWKVASTCEDGPEGLLFFQTMGDLLENIIQTDLDHKDELINSLHALTVDLFSKIRYRKPNKALLLKNLIRNNIIVKDDVVEKLSSILTEDDLGVRSAFQHMSEENPEFIDKVLQNAASMLKYVPADERKTAHTLHRAIIKAAAETSERKVKNMLQKTESKDFYALVDDAIGLAKALGLGDVVVMLTDILKDSKSIPILARDPIVMEVLKRLTIMRQLAGKRPNFGYALHELKSDPYAARNDPRLRQLVRESAVLMVIPEESYVLRSSEDIPCSLFFGDNSLAVEDFMVRSRQSGSTFLILKRGVQMVVPREAARDVLTGKVPYTLLDENGIQYFKPLHVFNALNLPKVATNRFSNYGYSPKMTKPVRSASSTRVPDDAMKNLTNGSCSSQEMEEEFVLVKDYNADDDAFYLSQGERVKVLKTDDDDPTL
ncbi:hypothetical protein V9T40_002304 [Parthenolecanium corni]|uniref:Apolipophorin n=1 Tax=Parthenolecanium corni TaxID=536013 RepID=A0AAN9TWW5_9HEMI